MGRFRFNTAPCVPLVSRRKRRNTSISKFQRNSGAGSIHAFARYSDILRENYLPGPGSPKSNLSHLRTSCSHIIHQIQKKCNTLSLFFVMNFSINPDSVLYHLHKSRFPRRFSPSFYPSLRDRRSSSHRSYVKHTAEKSKFVQKNSRFVTGSS